MDAILEPIGEFWEGFLNNPIVQLASQLIVIYVVLLWLGTAYWAFRDMQARTENPILPYFAAGGPLPPRPGQPGATRRTRPPARRDEHLAEPPGRGRPRASATRAAAP